MVGPVAFRRIQKVDAPIARFRQDGRHVRDRIIPAPLAPELQAAASTAQGYASAAQGYIGEQAQNASNMAVDLINDSASRDKVLLGVAGVAVAAALGIACQKRLAETP